MKKPFLLCLSLLMVSSCFGPQRRAPAIHYGTDEGAGSAGVHAVKEGDTLWSISQRYNMALQDIAVTNNLHAPFHLRTGQRLKLPAPQEYRVRYGDSLYSISRMFEVDTSRIAQQNDLNPPYKLQVGDVLKMPSVTKKTSAAIGARTRNPEPAPVDLVAKPGQKPVRSAQTDQPQEQAQPTKKAPPRKLSKITAKTPKRSSSKFRKPVEGEVISSYGPKKNGLHNDGINIKAAKGTPVRGADNGVVVYAGNELKGSGNLVLVRHDNRWMTAYAHMDKILVNRGDVIQAGQTIGTVGSTGSVDSPQLHFEVRRGTEALNPKLYMN